MLVVFLLPAEARAQLRQQVIFHPSEIAVNPDIDTETAVFPSTGGTSTAQPANNDTTASRINFLQAELNAISVSEGPYSGNLINRLVEISHYYKQDHQYGDAVNALETARQLSRIRYGLQSDTQIPILRELAESLKYYGMPEQAYMELTRQVNLQYKHSNGNPEQNAGYTVEYARNLFSLAKHAYHHQTASPDYIHSILNSASTEYRRGISMMSRFIRDSEEQIAMLNSDRIQINYLIEKINTEQLNRSSSIYANRVTPTNFQPSASGVGGSSSISTAGMSSDINNFFRPMTNSYSPLRSGINLIENEVEGISSGNQDTESLIDKMLDLADWNLLAGYQYTNDAHQLYQQTYSMLQQSSLENREELITEKYHPAIPVQIPAFIPHDYSLQAYAPLNGRTTTTIGFIDVSFMVDRNGHAKKINTLFSSPELDEGYKKLLVQDLRRNQYRPAYVNNEPVRRTYSLRYYVSILE